MPRWSVRNVSPETVLTVRQIQAETGLPVGSILDACVKFGAEAARVRLAAERDCDGERQQRDRAVLLLRKWFKGEPSR